LRLGYWNVDIPFKGEPRWLTKPSAKQGRLIITYDPIKRRWYAKVAVEAVLERELSDGLKAGVDLGRKRLIAFVTEPLNESGEDAALLYRGGPLKSDYFYFERRWTGLCCGRSVGRLYDKRRRRGSSCSAT
jgi:transposase